MLVNAKFYDIFEIKNSLNTPVGGKIIFANKDDRHYKKCVCIITEQNFSNLLLFLIVHKMNLADEWIVLLVILYTASPI